MIMSEKSKQHVDSCRFCWMCHHICPADVYELDENLGEIVVRYENCLECGACRISCPKNAISWEYPTAGCGVILKNN